MRTRGAPCERDTSSCQDDRAERKCGAPLLTNRGAESKLVATVRANRDAACEDRDASRGVNQTSGKIQLSWRATGEARGKDGALGSTHDMSVCKHARLSASSARPRASTPREAAHLAARTANTALSRTGVTRPAVDMMNRIVKPPSSAAETGGPRCSVATPRAKVVKPAANAPSRAARIARPAAKSALPRSRTARQRARSIFPRLRPRFPGWQPPRRRVDLWPKSL